MALKSFMRPSSEQFGYGETLCATVTYIVGQWSSRDLLTKHGRFGIGRHWQNGIHQAVEAKEGLANPAATTVK